MDFDNIQSLAGKFKTQNELQEYCDAQYKALDAALTRCHALELEVAHLKELLSGTVPLVKTTPEPKVEIIPRSDEQTICEIQINMLKDIAMSRPLTLEETKRLDLFVKNLMLAKGHAQAVQPDYKRLPPNTTGADLLAIASMPDSEEA